MTILFCMADPPGGVRIGRVGMMVIPVWKEPAMASINIIIELTDEFIYDVLTTAVEGSINYWASFSEINRDVDTHSVISAVIQDKEWHYNHDVADMDDQPEFKDVCIEYDTVVLGIQRLLGEPDGKRVGVAKYILQYIETGVREMDAGNIDSEAADAIIQAGVFSELVYG